MSGSKFQVTGVVVRVLTIIVYDTICSVRYTFFGFSSILLFPDVFNINMLLLVEIVAVVSVSILLNFLIF